MRTTIRSASRVSLLPRLAVLAAVALLLAACAGAATSVDQRTAGGADLAPVPAVAPGAPEVSTTSAGYEVGSAGSGGTASVGSNAVGAEVKVVKTGSMTIEVSKIDDAVAAARTAVVGLGGYVSATASANKGDVTFASITYRIPAERWDEALAALKKLGSKVLDEQTNAVEVTGQVLDLDARIRNLKATETQLLAIMAKAERIADILAVQMQLTDVQGQIEQLSTEKAHLEDQAALGTLTVGFQVPVAAIQQTQQGWDLGKQIDGAVAALLGLIQGIASLAIWLVVVGLPALVLVLVVLLVLRALVRRFDLRLPKRSA